MLSINTSGFGGTIATGAGLGFSLSTDANDIYLTYVGGSGPTTTAAHYTLGATAGILNLLKGATTTVTATITNSGSGTNDQLSYTALTVNGSAPASGGPLGFGASGGTGAVAFTGVSFGNATLTPTVSATSSNIGGPATQDGATTSAVINVGVATVVGSGGTFAGATTLTSQAIGAGGSLAGLASETIAGGPVVGTVGTIVAGTTTAGTTATMQWRAPNGATETGVGTGLVSDVLRLGGMNSGDVYTVSLTYSASLLSTLYGGNPYAQLDELVAGNWVKAGTHYAGNVAPDGTPGDYGYAGGVVWANLTGTSGTVDLAAVPEPSTIILMLSGLAMAIFAWRRKK